MSVLGGCSSYRGDRQERVEFNSALIVKQILPTNSLGKCMEVSLILYVNVVALSITSNSSFYNGLLPTTDTYTGLWLWRALTVAEGKYNKIVVVAYNT